TTVRSLLEPKPQPGGRYRLFSVPLDFGPHPPNLAALLDELGTHDVTTWRAFRYLPEQGTTLELTSGDPTDRFSPAPGRAFWLISRTAHRIDTAPVTGLSTATGSEFPIVLAHGWN